MSKIILKGFIIIPVSDLCAVQEELKHHTRLTLEEPGCIVFEVTQSESDSCRFDVYEEFTDMTAFVTHQERVKKSHWGKVSKNAERHYEILEQTHNESFKVVDTKQFRHISAT